jgi:hypothetical protein
MGKNFIINKEYLLLFLAHISISIFYGASVIQKFPIQFLFYTLFSFYLFKVVLKNEKYDYIKSLNLNKICYSIVLIGFIYSLFNIQDIIVPNYFLINFSDRNISTNKSNYFFLIFKSIVYFSALYMSQKKNNFIKIITTYIIIFITFSNFRSSRGSLLLILVTLYFIWNNYVFIRKLFLIILSIFFAFSFYILLYRLNFSSTSISTFNFFNNFNLKFYYNFNLQPDKYKLIFFWLPSTIKGNWVASNYYISENILHISKFNPFYYVITVGDYGLYKLSYGTFWFIYSIFGMIFSLYFIKIIITILPKFKYYFYILFLLILSRSGSESFLPLIYNSYILPFIILIIFQHIYINSSLLSKNEQ